MKKIKEMIYTSPPIEWLVQYYVFMFVWIDCAGIV